MNSPLRARAITIAGVVAWPALVTALLATVHDTVPAVLDGAASPDVAVAALAAGLGLAVLGWLGAVALLATVNQSCPGGGRVMRAAGRLERAIAPAPVRRAVALAVAGVLVSATAPAQASSGAGAPPVPVPIATLPASGTLDPGWAPAAPSPPSTTGQAIARRAETRPPTSTLDPSWGSPSRARPGVYRQAGVIVRRGDTLWGIAARHLGPATTDAEIAHTWPRWFDTNRAVIGPDPDRLVPGQVLRPPASPPGGPP